MFHRQVVRIPSSDEDIEDDDDDVDDFVPMASQRGGRSRR